MSNITKLQKGIDSPKKAFESLFGGEHEYVKNIHLLDLIPFKDQSIFNNYSDEKFAELVENIKTNGLHQPIIVRPKLVNGNNMYEILAGHHRTKAHEVLGFEKISAIIKEDLSDDDANLIFTDTNLNQREKLSIKEKAFAYKLQYNAIKSQGKRTDLQTSDEKITTGLEESARQIRRYIRLTELCDNLMDMVSSYKLPMMCGVNLSYISLDEQANVYNYIINNEISLSVADSETIKMYSYELKEVITNELLDKIFQKPTKEKVEKLKTISFNIPEEFLTTDISDIKKLTKDSEVLKQLAEVIDQYFAGI